MAKRLKKKIKSVFDLDDVYRKSLSIYDKLKEGQSITVYIVDSKPVRTIPQNKYYWGIVVKYIAEYLGYDSNEVHEILKYKFYYKDYNTKEGVIRVGQSTSSMNKQEFTVYIDSIREWANDTLNVYIPTVEDLNQADFYNLIENDLL